MCHNSAFIVPWIIEGGVDALVNPYTDEEGQMQSKQLDEKYCKKTIPTKYFGIIKTDVMKESILHFMRTWDLDDKLIYKDAAISQACFVRDTICGDLLKVHGFVVSTHVSKSCLLPVYFVTLRNGIKLIMRYNFYDWKVSVETPANKDPLPKDYLPSDCMSYRMTHGKPEKILSCYLEGFHEEWCYDAYDHKQPPRKFTIEIPSKEQLFVIIHRLKHAYPDVDVNVASDKRTADEIKQDIETILDNNGYNEYEPSKWDSEKKSKLMSVWEILWRTYRKIDSMRYDENYEKTEIYDLFTYSCESDVEKYAEVIVKYPEIHEEFLREEMMYNSEP